MYRWLQDEDNQMKHEFTFRSGTIRPSGKSFTLFCKFQKLTNTRGFYLIITLLTISTFALMIWLKVVS